MTTRSKRLKRKPNKRSATFRPPQWAPLPPSPAGPDKSPPASRCQAGERPALLGRRRKEHNRTQALRPPATARKDPHPREADHRRQQPHPPATAPRHPHPREAEREAVRPRLLSPAAAPWPAPAQMVLPQCPLPRATAHLPLERAAAQQRLPAAAYRPLTHPPLRRPLALVRLGTPALPQHPAARHPVHRRPAVLPPPRHRQVLQQHHLPRRRHIPPRRSQRRCRRLLVTHRRLAGRRRRRHLRCRLRVALLRCRTWCHRPLRRPVRRRVQGCLRCLRRRVRSRRRLLVPFRLRQHRLQRRRLPRCLRSRREAR